MDSANVVNSENSSDFCLQFTDSDYDLPDLLAICGFHLHFADSTYSCGFLDSLNLLNIYFNNFSRIPQSFSDSAKFVADSTNFVAVSAKLPVFAAILSNTVL